MSNKWKRSFSNSTGRPTRFNADTMHRAIIDFLLSFYFSSYFVALSQIVAGKWALNCAVKMVTPTTKYVYESEMKFEGRALFFGHLHALQWLCEVEEEKIWYDKMSLSLHMKSAAHKSIVVWFYRISQTIFSWWGLSHWTIEHQPRNNVCSIFVKVLFCISMHSSSRALNALLNCDFLPMAANGMHINEFTGARTSHINLSMPPYSHSGQYRVHDAAPLHERALCTCDTTIENENANMPNGKLTSGRNII